MIGYIYHHLEYFEISGKDVVVNMTSSDHRLLHKKLKKLDINFRSKYSEELISCIEKYAHQRQNIKIVRNKNLPIYTFEEALKYHLYINGFDDYEINKILNNSSIF